MGNRSVYSKQRCGPKLQGKRQPQCHYQRVWIKSSAKPGSLCSHIGHTTH
jgi:hypothetical protein